MSRKSDVITNFRIMKSYVDAYRNDLQKIQNDERYSIEGKNQKIEKLNNTFAEKVAYLNTETTGIIEAAESEVQKRFSATRYLSDTAHQTGLQNIISMLQLRAIGPDDFNSVVIPYKEDVNALAAFRTIIDSYPEENRKGYIIPGDPRKQTMQMLDLLKQEVEKGMSEKALVMNSTHAAIAQRYYMQGLNEDLIAE